MNKLLKRVIIFLHIPFSEEKLKVLCQFIKFGLVGLANTAISYFTYAACVYIGLHYFVANALGFVLSVLNSFYWNNKYVFACEDGEKRAWFPSLIKTFAAYGSTGIVLSSALLYVWVDVLHVSEYIAPLINLIITIPLNFVLNKLWAFKKEEKNL
ncbi:GtrA family protein [Wansuia hejianensis]|uniref:GtrA family protein n=1 Tax=Wansuia hejianensis TaxID=2763667 RepID=UPI00201697A6|nr:GtrA family protein [Wansuia hejianensis]